LATDPAWLRGHIVKIVRHSPDALPGILFHLGLLDVKPDQLVLELKGQIADQVLLNAIRAAMPWDRERLEALVTGDDTGCA